MWVGHMLDYVPDHILDHMIIGLVTTALQKNKVIAKILLMKKHLNSVKIEEEKSKNIANKKTFYPKG